jgi:hypothetical protein
MTDDKWPEPKIWTPLEAERAMDATQRLARNAALEEAARVCEALAHSGKLARCLTFEGAGMECARQIRNLYRVR